MRSISIPSALAASATMRRCAASKLCTKLAVIEFRALCSFTSSVSPLAHLTRTLLPFNGKL
jgi:hypothetical protein